MSWKIESVSELHGHEDRVWSLAWNPTKPLLASCSGDKSVRLYAYSTRNGALVESNAFYLAHTISTGHSRTVRNIAWSPSGKSLATASFDSTVGIWEQTDESGHDGDDGRPVVGEWECASTLEGHESECKSVGYSYNGNLLASCSRDKSVWVWEVQPDADFECLSVLMEHAQDVKTIAWHPREEILASASYDDTIKLYLDDPDDDWYPFATLTGHTSTVWALSFSPNGRYLASASDDLSIKIWRREKAAHLHTPETWSCVLTIDKAHSRTIYSVSWGPSLTGNGADAQGDSDSELGWLASGSADGSIKVWRITASPDAVQHELIASEDSSHGVSDVNAVSWCPRAGFQNLLGSAGDDGVLRVWRVEPASISTAS